MHPDLHPRPDPSTLFRGGGHQPPPDMPRFIPAEDHRDLLRLAGAILAIIANLLALSLFVLTGPIDRAVSAGAALFIATIWAGLFWLRAAAPPSDPYDPWDQP